MDTWKIPEDWYFGLHPEPGKNRRGQMNSTIATWGYEEFATNLEHFDSLTELEHPALEIFVDQVSRAGGFEHR